MTLLCIKHNTKGRYTHKTLHEQLIIITLVYHHQADGCAGISRMPVVPSMTCRFDYYRMIVLVFYFREIPLQICTTAVDNEAEIRLKCQQQLKFVL